MTEYISVRVRKESDRIMTEEAIARYLTKTAMFSVMVEGWSMLTPKQQAKAIANAPRLENAKAPPAGHQYAATRSRS